MIDCHIIYYYQCCRYRYKYQNQRYCIRFIEIHFDNCIKTDICIRCHIENVFIISVVIISFTEFDIVVVSNW